MKAFKQSKPGSRSPELEALKPETLYAQASRLPHQVETGPKPLNPDPGP